MAEITDENIVTYIRGLQLISRNDGTTKEYYHYNSHGDISSITDSTGYATQVYRYDAFGNLQNSSLTPTQPFVYCGEYTDLSSGLIYLRNRWYDPVTSRMISEDPYWKYQILTEHDMQGLNLYLYCMNDPINRIDPSGLDSYIFYDPNDVSKKGNGAFVTEEKARILKQELQEKYGTDCHMIAIDSYDYFIEKFNHIGRNGNEVDAVVLYLHTAPNMIGFSKSDGSGNFQAKVFTTDDMSKITNNRALKALIFLGCDGADGSKSETIANSFAKKSNINLIVASDVKTTVGRAVKGSVTQSYITETSDNRRGYKVYWKGVGTPPRIDSSFIGIGALIDAANAIRR